MGLDVSHDAFHGAYSAFNRFRQAIAAAMGGSFPPHYEYGPIGDVVRRREGMDDGKWYWGEGYSAETNPGLAELMCHSDCDGEISPESCLRIAAELEDLLPAIDSLGWVDEGHIGRDGGYVEVTKRFIRGCRDAAAAGEQLVFA